MVPLLAFPTVQAIVEVGSIYDLNMAISTNKMHARGPMGLRELTSYKWIVVGTGHVRT